MYCALGRFLEFSEVEVLNDKRVLDRKVFISRKAFCDIEFFCSDTISGRFFFFILNLLFKIIFNIFVVLRYTL